MFCNVYPQTIAGVTKCITEMDESYNVLKKFSSEKNVYAKHWNDYENFWTANEFVWWGKIYDQQKLWEVEMTDLDNKLLWKTKACSTSWLLFNMCRSKMGNKP